MHYAVCGQTVAEIVVARADRKKPLMGLTSFKGNYITTHDVSVAKNYLSAKELKQLNLIVSLYLDFAELQASNERPMKMIDWVTKLDEFLKLSEKKVLNGPGKISAKKAENMALAQFAEYKKHQDKKYVSDFDQATKKYLKTKS